MKKHPVGKFYVRDCLGHYPAAIDGEFKGFWNLFVGSYSKPLENRVTGQIHTESIFYFDSFKEALKFFLRMPGDWGRGGAIYKVTPYKNVKCTGYPKTEKSYNNLKNEYF